MWRWTNFIPICKYPLLPVSFVDENFLVPLCVIGTFYQKQLYINVSASFFVSYTIPFVYVSTFYTHKILFSSVNFTLGFDYVACVWICTFFSVSFWFFSHFDSIWILWIFCICLKNTIEIFIGVALDHIDCMGKFIMPELSHSGDSSQNTSTLPYIPLGTGS